MTDPDHAPAESVYMPREFFVLRGSREHEAFKSIKAASARIIIDEESMPAEPLRDVLRITTKGWRRRFSSLEHWGKPVH